MHAEIAAIRDGSPAVSLRTEWPTEIIESLTGEGATSDALRLAVSGSDFDIVHIAGHAGWADNSPVLEVATAGGSPELVASRDLGQWLRRSSVGSLPSCCDERQCRSQAPSSPDGGKHSVAM